MRTRKLAERIEGTEYKCTTKGSLRTVWGPFIGGILAKKKKKKLM